MDSNDDVREKTGSTYRMVVGAFVSIIVGPIIVGYVVLTVIGWWYA